MLNVTLNSFTVKQLVHCRQSTFRNGNDSVGNQGIRRAKHGDEWWTSWKLRVQCNKFLLGKWHGDAHGRRSGRDFLLLSVECCLSHRIRTYHTAGYCGECAGYTRHSVQVNIFSSLEHLLNWAKELHTWYCAPAKKKTFNWLNCQKNVFITLKIWNTEE